MNKQIIVLIVIIFGLFICYMAYTAQADFQEEQRTAIMNDVILSADEKDILLEELERQREADLYKAANFRH